ncbi:hypothetical protein DICPUDRAFT_157377 [Dictyostelium purpureum]|uniref:Right handed beta helix domain-containing protein n=1 Tax=Dictyostelium purpureum TaxID=5786 RepID=F0ZYZ5_DICPU|nr:uncharacterized protein DICPUDRAFT_157377 [Dictyostelium purpureum]EGC30829.1 hypothetical protein DICPUDRAFT_157377 [Dictyostelium purpureum]|eukprot:XP_003292643.1 hypothetical protein DICPUDRAFT_157377 [Dictyostelium purpureum]
MIKFLIIVFLIINLFFIKQTKQSINHKIYLDDENGNDLNNGTINFPYYSACKLAEVLLNSSNPLGDNYSIYFNNGGRFIGYCSLTLNGYRNITFQNYTPPTFDSSKLPSNNVNPSLLNLEFQILSSNVSISNVDLIYESSILLKFNCIDSSLQFYSSFFKFVISFSSEFIRSQVFFSNMKLIQNFYSQLLIPIKDSRFEIYNSSIRYQSFQISNTTFISNDSTFDNCFLNIDPIGDNMKGSLLFKNSIIDTTQFNFSSISNQNTKELEITIIDSSVSLSYSTNIIFGLVSNNKLIIKNCKFSSIGIYFISLFGGSNASLVIQDTQFIGFRFGSGFLSMENSTIDINNITFSFVQSKSYFYLYECNATLSEIHFGDFYKESDNLKGDTLVDIKKPSNLVIRNSQLVYSGNIILGYYNPDGNVKFSNITISDSKFYDTQGFQFTKSKIQFTNVIVKTFRNLKSVFDISFHSSFNCKNCQISSTSLLGYIFYIKNYCIAILEDSFISNSSSIVYSNYYSIITFKNCSIHDVYSTNTNMFQIEGTSVFYLDNCNVYNVFCVGQSFLYSYGSKVFFKNNRIKSNSYGLGGLVNMVFSNGIFLENSIGFSSFQNYLFNFENTFVSMERTMISFVTCGNKEGSLFTILNGNGVVFNDTTYERNSVPVFYNISSSYVQIKGSFLIYNSGIFAQSFSNSRVLIVYSTFFSIPSATFKYLFFFKETIAYLYKIQLSDSVFMGSSLEAHNSTISLFFVDFIGNSIFLNNNRESSFLIFKNSNVTIKSSTLDGNIQSSDNLIEFYNCTATFKDNSISYNKIEKLGYLIYFNNSTVFFNSTTFKNSTSSNGMLGFFDNSESTFFENNFLDNVNQGNGGIAYFDSSSNGTFNNNSFINTLSQIGGVLFTEEYFQSNQYNNNIFNGNKAIYGNTIASYGNLILLLLPDDESSFPISYISVIDFYNNVVTNLNSIVIVQIFTLYTNGSTSEITLNIFLKGGLGSFSFSFNAPSTVDHFKLDIEIPDLGLSFLNATKNKTQCLQFQIYNGETGQCQFCPYNQVSIQGICTQCPEKMKCLDSHIYTIDNYYLIINSPSEKEIGINSVFKIYQCPFGFCFEDNQCYSDNAKDILCSRCEGDYLYEPSKSKNGLYCCSNGFKPVLILGYLFFNIGFALVLSNYKYSIAGSLLGSIIILIQINSIVFFSYPGLYILPLFRTSIDFIFNYCTFKINYLYKFNIQLATIFIVYLIGISDITSKLIVWFYSKQKLRFFGRLFISSDTIQRISKENKSNLHNSKVYWNVFLMILQPLLFNLFSIIISKNIENQNYLIMDITIQYYSTSHIISLKNL